MPTIIDEFTIKLGLDAAGVKRGKVETAAYLKETREAAARTGSAMEASGKQAADFFAKIKNEALGLIAVLLGSKGVEDFFAKTTTSLASLGREARNIGESSQALSAFSNVIERNGGSADAAKQSLFGLAQQIENFKVYGDPSILKFLNPIGADINDSPLGIFMKFMKFAQEHANDPQLVNLIGHGLGFDQGTINAAEQIKTVAEYQKEYNEALKDAPTQQAIDEAQRLQNQWNTLRQAGASLGNAIFTNLEPALETAAKGMRDWLEANRGWLADDITGKVHSLGDDIKYAAGMLGDWKSTAELIAAYFAGPFVIAMMAGLGPVAAAVAAIVAGLALIEKSRNVIGLETLPVDSPLWAGVSDQEQSNYVNSPRSQAFLHPGNPNPYHLWNPGSWGGREPTPLQGAQITPPQPGTPAHDVMEQTRAFWASKGFTPDQVAGILSAGPAAESGFDPDKPGDNGTSYGLYQEHADRMQAMFAQYGPHPTAQQQNEFAWQELNQPQNQNLLRALRASNNSPDTAQIWTRGFERPADLDAEATRRASGAPRFLPSSGQLTHPQAGQRAPPALPVAQRPHPAATAAQYAPPPAVRYAPQPAAASAPSGQAGAGIEGTSQTEINIGTVIVNTQATDAKGIARDLPSALVAQANRGLQ